MKLQLIHESGCLRLDADMHIYIVDPQRIIMMGYGYHRLHHVLHLCVEQNIEVYHGNTLTILAELISTRNITSLCLQSCDDTQLLQKIQSLSNIEVTIHRDPLESLIHLPPQRSFFSFYKKAEPFLRKRYIPHE